MQIRHVGIETHSLELRVWNANCPLERIPVNFQISPEAQATRNTWLKHVRQVKEADLLAPRRKTHIWPHYLPAAFAIGNFQAERLRLLLLSLADSDID